MTEPRARLSKQSYPQPYFFKLSMRNASESTGANAKRIETGGPRHG